MWWLGRRAMPWGSSGTRTRTVSKLRSFNASNSAPRRFTNCILFHGAACLACGILAMYEMFRFDEESDLFGRASVLGRDFFGTLNTRESNGLAGGTVGVYGNDKEFA